MIGKFASLLSIAALALAGCSVGPHYTHPDIPVPAHWKQSSGSEAGDSDNANAAKSSSASDAPPAPGAAGTWPAAGWWRGFGSPQLDDLIAEAQKNNDDLAVAVARIREADAQLRIAGAALLPTVDLSGGVARQRVQVSGQGSRLFNTFSPGLNASYVLDFWGKNRATRQAAAAAAQASRFDRQTVALTVVSDVATTYFQALELRDRIQVAQENLKNGEKVLQGLRLQENAGIATGLDVAQQETTVALQRAAIPPLVQQLRQAVTALALLLGKSPESLDVDSGTLAGIARPAIVEGLSSQLLTRRPDVAEAEQNLIAANADIVVARASLFPNIDLTASGGYASSALATAFMPASRVYALSAGLTQPIFHGGALRGQYRYSKARYEELLSSYHKTVMNAFGNVENALTATQQVAEQERRQHDAVEKAQRAYDFARRQMAAGTVNILAVLNTENALFNAQDELVQIQYLHLQALVNLFTALGGGWRQG